MEQALKKKKKEQAGNSSGTQSSVARQKETLNREEKAKLLKRYMSGRAEEEAREEGLRKAVRKDRERQVAGDDVSLNDRLDLKEGSLRRKEDPEKAKARKKFQDKKLKLNTDLYLSRLERSRKELSEAEAEKDRERYEQKLKELRKILLEMQERLRTTIGEAKAAGFLTGKDQNKTLRKMEAGLVRFTEFTEETLADLSEAVDAAERQELLTGLFGNIWEFVGLESAWNEQDWGDRLRALDEASEEFEDESVLEPVFERYRFAEYKDEVTRNARGLIKQNMTGSESREAAHRVSELLHLDPKKQEDTKRLRELLSKGKGDTAFSRDLIDRYLGLDKVMDRVSGKFSGLTADQKQEILDEIRAFTERKLGVGSDEALAEKIVKDAPAELEREEKERLFWMEYSREVLGEEEEAAAGTDGGGTETPPTDGAPFGDDGFPDGLRGPDDGEDDEDEDKDSEDNTEKRFGKGIKT